MRAVTAPLLISIPFFGGLSAIDYSELHWAFGIVAASLFAVTLIGVYYFLLGLSMASVLIRAVFALIPVGLVTSALVWVVLGLEGLQNGVLPALIAATIVAAGWVVGYMTGEWRRVGAEQERRRDMIRAAITELELIADHGQRADWEQAKSDVQSQFAASTSYTVFIYYGHQYQTLRRLIEQIEVLEWDQIRPVMDVFQALDRLDRMESKIMSDAFASLAPDRRESGMLRYLNIHSQIPDLADKSVKSLRDGPYRGVLGGLK